MSKDNVINIAGGKTPGERDTDTEANWLLRGKLAPPQQRVSATNRTALLERMSTREDAALSLIVSPPGFGKTTLLTQWFHSHLESSDTVHAWLTLDEADSEPGRFMAGVILAVAKSGVDVGSLEIGARQQSIDMNVRQLVATFLAQIQRSQRRLVIILDDYHRARSPAIDALIELLIDNGYPHIHLVIASRQKPTFHVSAFAVRGLVTTYDAADLAMSEAEAAEIVGDGVAGDELALLHKRSEGWAVALQLARLWLDRGNRRPGALHEFSGRSSEMTDYLSEQIIQDLPADLRDFLLDTCILDRFDSSLADAVRDRSDSAEILERLTNLSALIIRLEGPRDTFRYHGMFQDFLMQRLHRGPAGRVATQHRRAARWLANAGDLLEAVKHAIRAGDTHLAVDLVHEGGGWELILARGTDYVRILLKLFSDVTIRANPVLQLLFAYLELKSGHYDSARELIRLSHAYLDGSTTHSRRDYLVVAGLARAYTDDIPSSDSMMEYERELENLPQSDHLGRGTLLSAVTFAALANGDLERVEQASRTAIQQMRAAGSVLGANYFFLHLGQRQILGGRLREAESLYRESLAMAEENFGADSGLKALSVAFLAESLLWRSDLNGARQLLQGAFETIETLDGWLDVYATAYEVLIRCCQATGNFDLVLEALARASGTARTRQLTRLAMLTTAWRVEQLVIAGHTKEARAEARAAGLAQIAEQRGRPGMSWRVRLASTIALARLSLATGAASNAFALLEPAIFDYRSCGLIFPGHRLSVLSLIALRQRGGPESEAVTRMEALLQFIVDEGATRLVLEHGDALESLLHVAQRRNRELILSSAQRDTTARLLAALHDTSAPGATEFSSRELAVLRELCSGSSNKVIGQLLDLSENTVKFHLKRIFKKLEVDSRAAAIAAALQRGIVDTAAVSRAAQR